MGGQDIKGGGGANKELANQKPLLIRRALIGGEKNLIVLNILFIKYNHK